MHIFLKKNVEEHCFELELDTSIFRNEIILKASYQYLDLGYFFFKTGENHTMIVQYTPKEGVKQDPEKIISEFSDTLLETSLRDTLEKENRVIREAIITKALYGVHEEPEENFTPTIDLGDPNKQESTLDFDRDIEDIIKEIENDPDLQIDEDEIQKMLDEIENDTSNSPDLKPTFTVDPSHIDSIKDQFKKKQ